MWSGSCAGLEYQQTIKPFHGFFSPIHEYETVWNITDSTSLTLWLTDGYTLVQWGRSMVSIGTYTVDTSCNYSLQCSGSRFLTLFCINSSRLIYFDRKVGIPVARSTQLCACGKRYVVKGMEALILGCWWSDVVLQYHRVTSLQKDRSVLVIAGGWFYCGSRFGSRLSLGNFTSTRYGLQSQFVGQL